MPFHILEIEKPSTNAISKLRKGMPVRISAGSGFPIVVHSDRLDDIGRKFSKGVAHTVSLTKDELNKNYEHLSGSGIFGKKFDQTLEKHGVKKLAYHIGDMAKPMVKGGIDTLAGMASVAQPELAPLAMGAAYLANDYIDNPNSYTHETVKKMAKDKATEQFNKEFNTNVGADMQASLNNLSSNNLAAQIQKQNGIAQATSYISPIITSGLGGPETLQQVTSVPTVLPTQDMMTVPKTYNKFSSGRGLYVNATGGRGLGVSLASGGGLSQKQLTDALISNNVRHFRGQGLHSKRAGKQVEKASVMVGGNLIENQQSTSSQPYLVYNMQSNFVPTSVRKFRSTVTNWNQ